MLMDETALVVLRSIQHFCSTGREIIFGPKEILFPTGDGNAFHLPYSPETDSLYDFITNVKSFLDESSRQALEYEAVMSRRKEDEKIKEDSKSSQ